MERSGRGWMCSSHEAVFYCLGIAIIHWRLELEYTELYLIEAASRIMTTAFSMIYKLIVNLGTFP